MSNIPDGWTIANHEADPNWWMVVYVEAGVVTRAFGGGTKQEARTVAAALQSLAELNLDPGNPRAQGVILKSLKMVLDLAQQKAAADGTLTLYDYDLKVLLRFIMRIESRLPENAPPAIPETLN